MSTPWALRSRTNCLVFFTSVTTRTGLLEHADPDAPDLLALLLEGATRTIRLAAEAFHDAGIDMPHARYLGPVASEAGSLVQWIRVEHLLPDDVKALLFPGAHA